MRKIVITLALSLLIISLINAQKTSSSSSSAKTSSSSSSVANNNTNNSTNSSSSSSDWTYSCTKGDDSTCTALNTTYCCLYTKVTYTGQTPDEDYQCGPNPDYDKNWFERTYGDLKEELSEAIYQSSGYEYTSYCANGVFIKATLAALALAFAGLF